MVAFNFQKQFAADVENGEKRQTIRAHRKDGRRPKIGDALQLYTGMRTKACRKLRDAACHDVCDIRIDENRVTVWSPQEFLDPEALAKSDGFKSWAEMRDWFAKTHGLPFKGIMVRWLVPPRERGGGAG